jgi:hypothetical protein
VLTYTPDRFVRIAVCERLAFVVSSGSGNCACFREPESGGLPSPAHVSMVGHLQVARQKMENLLRRRVMGVMMLNGIDLHNHVHRKPAS